MDLFSGVLPFVHVAEARSFRRAAASLGVTTAAVSKAVSRLEAELGVSLLRRTSRVVTLTPEGEAFLERAREAVALVRAARAAAEDARSVARGTLRVSASPILGRQVVEGLARVAGRHAGLQLRLTLTDRISRLVEDEVDIAVRLGPLEDSSLVARPLRRPRWVTVASPAYLARRSAPPDPEDLAAHDAVVFETPRGTVRPWSFAGRADVTPRPRLVADHGDALVWAAEDGAGIAQILDFMAEGALAAGRLVELFPDRRAEGPPLHALCLPRRHGTPRVRVGLEALEEVLGVRAR